VVPYNPYLSAKFNAHINVEIASSVTAVKYLYKYVYKGHDRAVVAFEVEVNGEQERRDEAFKYLDARYVSSSEGVWQHSSY
jgi:hypothetical protein